MSNTLTKKLIKIPSKGSFTYFNGYFFLVKLRSIFLTPVFFHIYIYIYVTKQRFLYILEWLLNPCYVAFYISHAYCLMSLAYFFQTSLTPPAINVFSTLATAYCLKSLAYFLSISISFFTIISDVDNLVSNC